MVLEVQDPNKSSWLSKLPIMPEIPQYGPAPEHLSLSEQRRRLQRLEWTTHEGEIVHIMNMTCNHIYNIIKSSLSGKLKDTGIKSRWLRQFIIELNRRDTQESKEVLAKLLIMGFRIKE